MVRKPLIKGVALVALLALVAMGCGNDDKKDKSTSGKGKSTGTTAASGGDASCPKQATVAYSEPVPDPNFKILEQVISSDLNKRGWDFKSTNANLDPNKQISDVDSLLQGGADALIVNPVEPNGLQPALARVRAKNVPIVAQETQIGGPYTVKLQSTLKETAAEAAKQLKDLVGDGKVAAVVGPPFAEVLKNEAEGFKQGAQDAGLDVVDTKQNMTVSPAGAQQIAGAWLTKYGRDGLKGIFTFNDGSALGVLSAYGSGAKPKIVSLNGEPAIIPAIKSGDVVATYDLQQVKIGHALAWAAEQALCKKTMPETINLGLRKIDKSNVDEWTSPQDQLKEDFEIKIVDHDGKSFVDGTF